MLTEAQMRRSFHRKSEPNIEKKRSGFEREEGHCSMNDKRITKDFPVAMRLGDTPVLIPNTMVKT